MDILRTIRKQNHLTQSDVAKYLNISKQAYSNYELGRRTPDISTLRRLADFYNLPLDSLVVEDGEQMVSAGTVRIPVFRSVPAGIPIEAIEDVVDWEEIPKKLTTSGTQYFGLTVTGDSMYPKYLDGDVIIVRRQAEFESRDDCVVYVNGYNATLKSVVKNEDGTITLRPINPEYSPRTFSTEELEKGLLSIAGVVVELRRKIKP